MPGKAEARSLVTTDRGHGERDPISPGEPGKNLFSDLQYLSQEASSPSHQPPGADVKRVLETGGLLAEGQILFGGQGATCISATGSGATFG